MIVSLAPKVPLHVEMRRIYRDDDDHAEHRVEFGVVGIEAAVAVVISSKSYGDPVIKERIDRGSLDLSDRLIDSLAIACFRVVAGFIAEQDGNSCSWTARDISRWVRRHWAHADAEQILWELGRHVTPDLNVNDITVVSDDDNV